MFSTRIIRLLHRNQKTRKLIHRLFSRLIVRPFLTRLDVPVIAITGTNGKTTVTRLLSRIYEIAGYNVGACCTNGVMHNGRIIKEGDESNASGAWKAAKCADIDLLVLETARGGIIEYGLGFKKCQVGIVTNLFEDHLGFEGINTLEEMATVKSAVPKNTVKEGLIVLNGDDVRVRAMAAKCKAGAIYFVMESDYKQFERVIFLRGHQIWKKTETGEEAVINVEDVALTDGGSQRCNIANVMAVLGALEGMQRFVPVSQGIVKRTLTEFGSNPFDNIGGFHAISYQGKGVLLCSAKNPESLVREIKLIQRVKEKGEFRSVVGILTGPGNRNKKYFEDMSELAAPICDLFIVHPPHPKYLRGRSEKELVRLLSTNIPKDKILSEQRCTLSKAIALAQGKTEGKTLFVVFFTLCEADLNVPQLLRDAEIDRSQIIE